MIRSTMIVMLMVGRIGLLGPDQARAHGVIGSRFVPEMIYTELAFPADEGHVKLHSDRTHEGREQEWEFAFSKRLTSRLDLGIEVEHASKVHDDPNEPDVSGFKNPELRLRYAVFESPAREYIAAVGLSVELGFDTKIAPRLFFVKGFPEFPEGLSGLRPLAFGADLGVGIPLTASTEGGETSSTFTGRFFLHYSLLYLQTQVRDVGLGWPLNRLFPVVEVKLKSPANGPNRGRTEATFHPGLIWAGRKVEFAVAADLPLNDEAEVRGGVSVMVHVFLDDLAPQIFRPLIP